METTDDLNDPEDLSTIQDDTTRHNDKLALDVGADLERKRIRRAFKKRAPVPDEQEFRDAMTAEGPIAARDAQADMEDEIARVEALDVLEGLRSLQQGDPINWRIYRVGASESDLNGFLDTWSTSQLTQERLRDKFGGGTYRIRGTYSNGQFAGGRTVRVAGDAVRKEVTVSAQAGGFNTTEFLAQQAARDQQLRRENDERLAREKREREEADERRRKERNDMLAIVMPAVSAIGAALVGLLAPRQDNTAALVAALKPPDLLTTMTQLKALQGNSQDGVLTKILPMIIDMAGAKASAGDTGWLDVIKEFAKGAGPAVGSLIQQQLTNPPNPSLPVGVTVVDPRGPIPSSAVAALPGAAPPPTAAPGTTIVVPERSSRRERSRSTAQDNSAAGASVEVNPGQSAPTVANRSRASSTISMGGQNGADMNLLSLLPHLPWLKDMLGRMLAAASRGKDPEVYAALFLEEVPEEIDANTIVGLLGPENWFQMLCYLEPRWNDSRVYPWIEHVRGLILRQVGPAAGSAPGGTAPTQSAPGQGAAHGPGTVPQSQTPARASAARGNVTEQTIDRPTKLPSLTGE